MLPNKGQKALNENSRTAELLVELVDDLDLIFTFGYQPFAVMKYGMSGIRDMRKARAKRKEREAIRRLKIKNLIEIDKRYPTGFELLDNNLTLNKTPRH